MLEARQLTYAVNGRCLTNNVSFSLPGGEIVAILGPNGAGKSTLLRQLTGYLTPDSGECFLFGRPLAQWSIEALARTRAVMRQNSGIIFPFRVQEVINMGRHAHKSAASREDIATVMALCRCETLAQRDYRSLSGGEQQRVQLARLLLQLWEPGHAAKWLFLDEPTSALDIHYQQQLFRLLRELVQTRHFSICCVLHDLNLAALYADRILLLNRGQVVANGAPQQVLNEPDLRELYQADITVSTHPTEDRPLMTLCR
jgi:iron complex transport system ATP-binding protein